MPKEKQSSLKPKRGQDLKRTPKKLVKIKKLKKEVKNQLVKRNKDNKLRPKERIRQKKVVRKNKMKEDKAKENNLSHPDL